MTLSISLNVTGIKELKQQLIEISDELDSEIKEAISRSLAMVERSAVDNVNRSGDEHPQVRTGRLINSIMSEVIVNGDEVEGRVGSNVEYAPYLEFGVARSSTVTYLGVSLTASSHIAYPWLEPALIEHEDAIMQEFENAVARTVNTGK